MLVEPKFRDTKWDNGVVRMDSAWPIAPNDGRRKPATSTFHLYKITDNGCGSFETVLIIPQLLFGHDLARLQGYALNPIGHGTA